VIKTDDQTNPSLIVRLPNWVGDVVMALPALQTMHEMGIELFLLGKPWAIDLLAALDMNILSLTSNFWQTRKKIAAIVNTDKALLLTNSFSSALLTFLAGKAPIGYKTDSRQVLLKSSLSKQHALHEVQYFWNIAQFASQYWYPSLKWLKRTPDKITLPLCPVATASAKQRLFDANIEKSFWVLCPFAHGTGKDGKSKIWPHWPELSSLLKQQNIVVCPGKNEEAMCSGLAPGATVLSGLNLSEYAAILASADFVIANDSGPMHIAAAVGANTLGIFGASDPNRSRPWGANYIGELGRWPTVSEVQNKLHQLPLLPSA